ncbi:winged helix-turn-helix domain-containing protein [Henriciella aquimarina]|uniref:winged helix-turn-helix domain-containing protein n=1 Tax=Henriciella aquimarina TaxID=545261 RepID=UPI0009FEC001|nr:LysR family transcriptional regulator [Henriciella aquimarina]
MTERQGPGLSIRINLANGGRFGPGKAALLRAIAEHGSIRQAAQSLAMSYPRALKLIDEMNSDFTAPLLESSHGGATGGGSSLTQTGRDLLEAYDTLCAEAGKAASPALKTFRTQEKSA